MQSLYQTPHCKSYTILLLQGTYQVPLRPLWEYSEKGALKKRLDICLWVCYTEHVEVNEYISRDYLEKPLRNLKKRLDNTPQITYNIIKRVREEKFPWGNEASEDSQRDIEWVGVRKPEVGQSLEPPSAQIKDLTLDSLWSTMFIESERGTEKPFQVSPCEANECLSQVTFSVMQTDRTRSLIWGIFASVRFRYSRVVRFRPRDAYFSFEIEDSETLNSNSQDNCLWSNNDQTTIGRGEDSYSPP